jgi:hypothetical protein
LRKGLNVVVTQEDVATSAKSFDHTRFLQTEDRNIFLFFGRFGQRASSKGPSVSESDVTSGRRAHHLGVGLQVLGHVGCRYGVVMAFALEQ